LRGRLLLLLGSGLRGFRHCRLSKSLGVFIGREQVNDGSGLFTGTGHVSLTLHLNDVVLRALGGDAGAAVAGAWDRHGLVCEAELEADDQRVHVGRCDLHDADGFEELGVRADRNFVTVVIDVGHGVRRAGGNGGKALLKFLKGKGA